MRKFLLSIFATCLLVLTFSVVPAAADGDYKVYMQLDGISGDSTNKIYSKWIELTNVEFKISGEKAGSSSGTSVGKINFDSFDISKTFDFFLHSIDHE